MVVDHEAFFAPRDYKSPLTINLGTGTNQVKMAIGGS